MKTRHLFSFIALVALSLIASCSSDEPAQPALENKLVGTWRYQSPTYWYELTFNANLTGGRIDSEGQVDSFKYSFTATTVTFTETNLEVVNQPYSVAGSVLNIFGDVLNKK